MDNAEYHQDDPEGDDPGDDSHLDPDVYPPTL